MFECGGGGKFRRSSSFWRRPTRQGYFGAPRCFSLFDFLLLLARSLACATCVYFSLPPVRCGMDGGEWKVCV